MNAQVSTRDATSGSQRLLRLSYVGFISLGLPDTVLGAAWPSMHRELGLPLDAAGGVLLVTTGGVVLSSTTSGRLRARFGTGTVLLGSTLLAGSALLAMTFVQHWSQLLLVALCAGLGGGAIDAALNDYVAKNHSARHLVWLHACWGIGAATAPLIVALVLARGASWRLAYAALAALELLLSIAFLRTRSEWTARADSADESRIGVGTRSGGSVAASVAMFYVYGGLEVGVGLWASSMLIYTRHVSAAVAGVGVGLFWAALMLGRVASGIYADRVGPARMLRLAVRTVLLASIALAVPSTPAWCFMLALSVMGFALAPIYPLAMHDTPRRFPEALGSRVVGYQVAAASLGLATLPWLLGAVAARTSLFLLPGLLAVLAAALITLEYARRATVRSGGSR